MSSHPYTPEQEGLVHRCLPGGNEPYTGAEVLTALHRAGITLSFPEPRYFVRGRSPGHEVVDRLACAVIAQFNHYRASGAHADEYAARLNREEQP